MAGPVGPFGPFEPELQEAAIKFFAAQRQHEIAQALKTGAEQVAKKVVANPTAVRAVAEVAEPALVRVGVQAGTRTAVVTLLRTVAVDALIPGAQLAVAVAGVLLLCYVAFKIYKAADDAWYDHIRNETIKQHRLGQAFDDHVKRHCVCSHSLAAPLGKNFAEERLAFQMTPVMSQQCVWPQCKGRSSGAAA